MEISWLSSLKPEQIAFNSSLFSEFSEPQRIVVHIGLLKLKLDVLLKEDILEGTIGLSKTLSKVYTIPTDLPYEVFMKNREIHIGPVIAYVERGHFKDVKDQVYFSILPKFMDYHAVNGLIYICTRDSIKIKSGLVEGYYFDPLEQDPEKVWKRGTFPLPNALFNRSYMTHQKISMIQKRIGDTLFNSYWLNLNKWTLWKRLSKDEILKKHLPYTEKYLGVTQLKELLKKYDSVYLKPFNKSRGRGIMQVMRAGKGAIVIDNTMQNWHFENYQSLSRFFKETITIPYIVQQAVPFKLNNQQLDFRLILQKDGRKKWTSCGLMARVAPIGGIITNMRGMPETMLGSEALTKLFKFDKKTVEKIEREMTKLVIRAAEKYEEKGMHLGDLAADIILDANLHIWLLELQLNHAIYGNTTILPAEFFKPILTNPFKYAKALAGFYKG